MLSFQNNQVTGPVGTRLLSGFQSAPVNKPLRRQSQGLSFESMAGATPGAFFIL